jgi:RNA polymerase sigma-70 factor, ECF subfamily
MASSPETLHDRLAAGEAGARTEELFRGHHRLVRGLCIALLRDRTEAEDATQQVFLSAYKAILNGSEPREPAAWLATITRNECWARARAHMREPLPVADVETAGSGSHPDPLTEAIRRADLAALWAAIRALPRQQREALVLREFGGLSYGELARALDVSDAAVESLLFRARRRLREAYAASWIAGLFAGGSRSLATKAAFGFGAAALAGGGAVLAPHVFRHAAGQPRVAAAPVSVASVLDDLPPARVTAYRQQPAPAPARPKATTTATARTVHGTLVRPLQASAPPPVASAATSSPKAAHRDRRVKGAAASGTAPRVLVEDVTEPATTDSSGEAFEPATTTTATTSSEDGGMSSGGTSTDQTATTQTMSDGSGGGSDGLTGH